MNPTALSVTLPQSGFNLARPCEDTFSRALAAASEVQPDTRRARHVAFEALSILYPSYGSIRLGIRLGYSDPSNASARVSDAKRLLWWSEDHVDEVVGALVAELYGERAA